MATVGIEYGSLYRRTHSLSRLVWSEGRRPLGAVLHSLNEPAELSQWLCHDDSPIVIGIMIMITITITITLKKCYYYYYYYYYYLQTRGYFFAADTDSMDNLIHFYTASSANVLRCNSHVLSAKQTSSIKSMDFYLQKH